MPLQEQVQLISVDDHVIEHPRVWTDRISSRYLERAPHVVKADDGGWVWEYDDRRYPQLGLNAVAGKDRKDFGVDPNGYADMRDGCFDIAARIADMDIDQVQAQVCFPTFPGFAGRTFYEATDKQLALDCVRAWNDFMIDEWCAYQPGRQIPIVILPYWDVPESVREIERTASKGARGISFNERPSDSGLPSFHAHHWDPVFAAAQEAEMPVCLHFGSSGVTPIGGKDGPSIGAASFLSGEAPLAVGITLMALNSMRAFVDLLFSHTFRTFPRLRVLLAEGGIGWMPYMLERADSTWDRHRWYQDIEREISPSELFKEHIFGCFISDHAGLSAYRSIGAEQILWEGDYPHSDSNWPTSRGTLADNLKHVPDSDAALMAEENARRLFRFPRV